ncbi:MAG: hypothetical protein JNM66_16090 [Bryobacterales bacterium]|nr:hypothetical protein [Bryobacterales bacterium]
MAALAQPVATYVMKTAVGNGSRTPSPANDLDSVPALQANVPSVSDILVAPDGSIYFTERHMVRRYDPKSGLVTRIAGQFAESVQGNSFAGDGGSPTLAKLYLPQGLAWDPTGNLVVADTLNARIRRIRNLGTPSSIIETIAGNGTSTNSGDGGPVAAATFRLPGAIAYNAAGTLFVDSVLGFKLRTIEPNGMMGPSWGQGVNRCIFDQPTCSVYGLASGPNGTMLAADASFNQLFSISSDKKVSVLAGKSPFERAFRGDGGPALEAGFWDLNDVAVDSAQQIFLTDFSNQRVRMIGRDGVVQTIAGTGKGGTVGAFSGEDGLALKSDLAGPAAVAVDPSGRVYFSDSGNQRIRVLIPCKYEVKAASASVDSQSGNLEINVETNEPLCPWKATSEAAWLVLGTIADGTGSQSISLRVDANPTGAARTGTIRVGGAALTITQAAAGVVFPRLSAAAHGASFAAGVMPGAWTVLTGSNLATSTRIWTDSDFVGGRLPVSLDGVSVKIGGRDANVYFISPTQLNVLAPSGLPAGPATVEITNRTGKSTLSAMVRSISPAFFLVGSPRNGVSLAAAVHADSVQVGEVGAVPGAAARPAKPGDAITVYGTGFGPTNPPIPDGVAGAAPAALANELTVFVGGQKAQVDYAGVVGPGLVQVNLRVPEFLPTGRHSIIAAIGGVESPSGAGIAVE